MATAEKNKNEKLELLYTIFCDDVRLEVGNRFSFMGVFQNMMVQQLPFFMMKLVVINHWTGAGKHLSEVRILTPDRQQHIVASQPSSLEIMPGGYADNISFFGNVTFPVAGQYWVQTLVDSNLFHEQQLIVSDGREPRTEEASEAVN